ncbi:35347_t:CDS:2 [Gigaspora margarita]|uniref:Glycylpeptide N-tetradecanoyltransferase n=1 Tax=Gigaspora margarita TaxID=4874 RepID=A0ABN7UMG9_GIGMA|nr:35347_t:CDS:2 [Gigaspora margarita]
MDGKEHSHNIDGEDENISAEKLRIKQEKKNLKKARKKAAKNEGSTVEDTPATTAAKQAELQEKVRMLVNQLAIREAIQPQPSANSSQRQKDMSSHKFWSTQPVPRHGEVINDNSAIEENTPYDQIRKDPALQPPGYKQTWHVGVRVSSTKRLVAFISGIPADIRIYESQQHLVEINFLCVHKKLRSKRLAPVLIKEITRRSHLEGIFQAVYTAGVVLPKPISKARYYHRSLNPKKLIETNFSRLPHNTTMSRLVKKFKLPSETLTPGIRPMQEKDVTAVRILLNEYMNKFNFVAVFKNDDDVRHWILTKENVVWSYVVEDPLTKKVTDFFSFYCLPSSVIGNPAHKTINAVYLFYYAVQESDDKAIKGRLQALIKDALILAKLKNVDVFNCLDLMENKLFIEDLKFGPGDGYLNYYMYNWRCKDMDSGKVGVVML